MTKTCGAHFQGVPASRNSTAVLSLCITVYVRILQNDIFRKVSVIAMVLSLNKFFIHDHVQPHWSSGQITDM